MNTSISTCHYKFHGFPNKKKSPLFLANTDLLAILLGKDSNGFKLLGKKLNGLGLGFFWNSIEKKKNLIKGNNNKFGSQSAKLIFFYFFFVFLLYYSFHGVPAEERLHWRTFLVKLGADNLKGAKNEELFVASHKYVNVHCTNYLFMGHVMHLLHLLRHAQ